MVVITGRLDHFSVARNPKFKTDCEEAGYVSHKAWIPLSGFSKAEIETLHKVLVSVIVNNVFITENAITLEFEK